MNLLPQYVLKKLPAIGSTSETDDPMVICKFFTPWSHWTWYAIEYDGKDELFGYVAGDFPELGYFLLSELKSIKGPFGLGIERDLYFDPQPLSVIKAMHE